MPLSTNQSINPSINQSFHYVSQVVRWPFNQSVNQSINQSINQSLCFRKDTVLLLLICLTTVIRLNYTATAWQYWCVLNLVSIYRHWSRRAAINVTVVQTCKPEKCAHTIWIRIGNPVSTRLFFEQALCNIYILTYFVCLWGEILERR